MRRVCKILEILMLSLIVQAAAPVTAHAAWSWYWIDNWSGPGGFKGQQLEWRLVCVAKKSDGLETKFVPGIAGSGCLLEEGERRRASLDLKFGLFKANATPQYAGGKEIKLTVMEPSFSWHVWGPFDAGIGAGVSWFSSEGFESFSRVTLEPLRLDFRPFQADDSQKDWWRQVLVLRVGWVIIPRGFEANDFNATGTAARRIPSEGVFYKGIFLDSEPIIRRLLHRW